VEEVGVVSLCPSILYPYELQYCVVVGAKVDCIAISGDETDSAQGHGEGEGLCKAVAPGVQPCMT
jgi:hypothetical protein